MLPRAASGYVERARLQQAARQLETLVLKQLVTASKAFEGGSGAGSAIRAGLFADALADALVKGGGLGLSRSIEESVAPGTSPASPASPARPAASPAAWQLPPASSSFGPRHDPFDGHLTRHEGVDLPAAEGSLVRAPAGGTVVRSGARGGYGNALEIDHGNGLSTVYAHASELLVREGEPVAAGQPIARAGQTGRATGSHLHFEVRLGGTPVDPARALRKYALRADALIESGP
jgi:murein DD-endopeptidase MepM/ murein hydrolase activator NlpD